MKIATLTIDRGDRPKMIEQCKRLIKRQTRKPDMEIYVTEPSVSSAIDIVPRFRSGWLEAKNNNIDIIVVIESDDWYEKYYINNMYDKFTSFIISASGSDKSQYYNICNQTWQIHLHPGRASLYTTVFKTNALDDFKWPKDDYKFLDIPLWKHFNKKEFYTMIGYSDAHDYAVGIKHNEGIRAGIGHKATMKNKDVEFKYLESIIGEDVGFYKTFCNG